MFLLTNKAFAWLFLFLFILNIPLMVFYNSAGIVPDAPESQAKIDVGTNEADTNKTVDST